MKINKLQIDHYSPLTPTVYKDLGKFNLFFGPNESGKSLTIDALVKLLLGKKAKQFASINRVEQKPEGFVVMDIKGREIKLSKDKTLDEVADISPEQAENIFIIRDSELSIGKEVKEEMGFYTSVTDQLTGLKTDEIKKITQVLEEKGKITPTGRISNREQNKHLADRMEKAKELIKKIKDLKKNIDEKKAEGWEEKWLDLKLQLKGLKKRKEDMEIARQKQRLQKAKQALEELKKVEGKISELNSYSQEELDEWRRLFNDLKTLEKEKEEMQQELKALNARLEESKTKLKEINIKFETTHQRVERIANVQLNLDQAKEIHQRLAAKKQFDLLATYGLAASAFLLTGLFVGQILNFWLIGFGLFVFGLSVITKIIIKISKARLEKINSQLVQLINEFGFKGEDFSDVLSVFNSIKEKYQQLEKKLKDLETKKEVNKELIADKEEVIKKIENKIKQLNGKVFQLQKKSGQETWQEYQTKLKNKQNWLTEREKILERLSSISETKPKENNLQSWQKIIGQWRKFEDLEIEVEFSEEKFENLKIEINEVSSQIEEVENKINFFQEKVSEIGGEANKVLKPFLDSQLHTEAIADLPIIEKKLLNFRKKQLGRKKLAWQAIEVFNQIGKDEKSKVGELFGENSSVSDYFTQITEGKYKEVFFNQEAEQIYVKDKKGDNLPAEKLSGGAFDQLYLSIRLALGKKLLGNQKGFFIMDDPFIKADWQRLPRLLGILHDIAESGWQILYFSTKQEVKDNLSSLIENKKVKLFEV